MKVMHIVIAYDKDGNIFRIAKVHHLPKDIPHPFADLTKEHDVLSIEKPGDLQEANLLDIQRQFRVDLRRKKLVPKE